MAQPVVSWPPAEEVPSSAPPGDFVTSSHFAPKEILMKYYMKYENRMNIDLKNVCTRSEIITEGKISAISLQGQ